MVLRGEWHGEWQDGGTDSPFCGRSPWRDGPDQRAGRGVAGAKPVCRKSAFEWSPGNGATGWLWNGDGSLLKPNAGKSIRTASVEATARTPIESAANRRGERRLRSVVVRLPCSCSSKLKRGTWREQVLGTPNDDLFGERGWLTNSRPCDIGLT
jgi:hypothetical protein